MSRQSTRARQSTRSCLACETGETVFFSWIKNASLQKFFGAPPQTPLGGSTPPVPHLQSTFIRGWLRPCVDLTGWQAKMASIEIWIPWRNAHMPHYPYSKPVPLTLLYASFELSLIVHELPQGTYRLTVTTSVYIYIMIGVDCQYSPCARSRIPISRSPCPATFVSEPKSTHFVAENPNLLVVISTELRMLPNERFCSPSLKRSSFLGNKGHVRDCP